MIDRSTGLNLVTVRNLRPDNFNVSVYVLNDNGVPLNRSANIPKPVVVMREPNIHITPCQGLYG